MTTLPSWAVPGRKVVCVKVPSGKMTDTTGRVRPVSHWGYEFPVVKEVYTIREAFIVSEGAGLYLREIRNDHAPNAGGRECGFPLQIFRPVVTLEEDMLTFRSLLNTVPATKELTQ